MAECRANDSVFDAMLGGIAVRVLTSIFVFLTAALLFGMSTLWESAPANSQAVVHKSTVASGTGVVHLSRAIYTGLAIKAQSLEEFRASTLRKTHLLDFVHDWTAAKTTQRPADTIALVPLELPHSLVERYSAPETEPVQIADNTSLENTSQQKSTPVKQTVADTRTAQNNVSGSLAQSTSFVGAVDMRFSDGQ